MPHGPFRRLVAPDPNNGIRGDKVKPSTFDEIYDAIEDSPTNAEVAGVAGITVGDYRTALSWNNGQAKKTGIAVSPLLFGAEGDGVTDDSDALALMIATIREDAGYDVGERANMHGYVIDGQKRSYLITEPFIISDMWFLRVRNFHLLVGANITAALEIGGASWCEWENFFVSAVGNWSGFTCDHVVKLETNQGVDGTSGASSSNNKFRDVQIMDVKHKIGFAIGVDSGSYQVDFNDLTNCTAQGQYDYDNPSASDDPEDAENPFYQYGYQFGSGTSANIVINSARKCNYNRYKYGVNVRHTDLLWDGGGGGVCEVDFNHTGTSNLTIRAIRTEHSQRFLQTASGTGFAPNILIQGITNALDDLHADGYWILHQTRGSLRVEDVVLETKPALITPRIRMTSPDQHMLEIHGYRAEVPIEECVSYTGAAARGTIYNYTQINPDTSVAVQHPGPVLIGETRLQGMVPTIAPDNSLYRANTGGYWNVDRRFISGEGFDVKVGGGATEHAFRAYEPGGTQPNFDVLVNGTLGWGPGGSTAPDVTMSRVTATPEGSLTASPGSVALSTGGIVYYKSTGTGNTGWVSMGAGTPPVTKYLTADQATTLDTAQDITGFSFAIGANEAWIIDFNAWVQCDNTGGLKIAVTGPASSTFASATLSNNNSTTNMQVVVITAASTLSAALNKFNGFGLAKVQGVLKTAGTSGTAKIQFASTTAGQTSTMKALGTYLLATKVT